MANMKEKLKLTKEGRRKLYIQTYILSTCACPYMLDEALILLFYIALLCCWSEMIPIQTCILSMWAPLCWMKHWWCFTLLCCWLEIIPIPTCILSMWVPLCWMKARKLSRGKLSEHWPQVIVSGDPEKWNDDKLFSFKVSVQCTCPLITIPQWLC